MIRKKYYLYLTLGVLLLLQACLPAPTVEDTDVQFSIPEGFEIEDIYVASDADDGSWVSLAEGPDNQFFACDQYGSIYTFQMPPPGQQLDSNDVQVIDLNIGYAHGLLWAFNSLYVVVVNEYDEDFPERPTSGVYRLRDTDNDGVLDFQEKLLSVDGQSEHGPHTLRVGPDSASLYFIAGNFNSVPDHFTSRLPRNWGEDNLFPPYLDARGHAVDLKAPGGWVARTDPDGKEWELYGAGMRNPFSFGINRHGDLFAYDADMEWDFGMPWYRPTRILHVTSGSEFGWRTGSGKWPVAYPDNLPAVENMAQGSPTAVIMGQDLAFPTRYQTGLFACDWSFGTIYFVDITENGSSYTGKKEEFMSGVPLPISNAIAGSDGHLYFTTGGRRLESHLYRLRYTGGDSVDSPGPSNDTNAARLRQLRRSLEAHHLPDSPGAINASWPHLDHPDEFVRYAARIAIEHQPLSDWEDKLWEEFNTERIVYAALAYARADGPLNHQIIQKLEDADWTDLSDQHRIALLRTYALLLIRQGKGHPDLMNRISERLNPMFPSENAAMNRLLSQLLLYLDHPEAVKKCIALLEEIGSETLPESEILNQEQLDRSEQYGPQIKEMIANMPPTEGIHYVTVLSHVSKGWTPELRKKYFQWFFSALSKKGGMSYKPFLDNIRAKALSNIPEGERAEYAQISGFYSPTREMAELPQPMGPGREYNLIELGGLVLWNNEKFEEYEGTIADGKRVYEAALCSSCHRMKDFGGGSGPDLTNLHTRFNRNAIANTLLSPNEEISDQYAFTVFDLKGGDKITGRIVSETDEHYVIYQSPYDVTNTTQVAKTEVVSKELSPISPMPAKLLDRLNEQEVLDLFVYLLSGADEGHEYYQ